MAHQGKMSARDLQKMKQNPGLAYATKPASELAMDNRDVWQVRMPSQSLPSDTAPARSQAYPESAASIAMLPVCMFSTSFGTIL